MTIRIGLTGPIGCGKSTVAGWLGEQPGVRVIDADAVARDVLAPGTVEAAAVEAHFGDGVRAADGSLDRAALARVVFADAEALRALEAIVHPAVRRRILADVAAAEADGAVAVTVEAIKLVEGGLAELCDEVWLVDCEPSRQRERLGARGMAPDEAARRIAMQADLSARVRPRATRVIDTSGTAAQTRALVDDTFAAALAAAGGPPDSRTASPRA